MKGRNLAVVVYSCLLFSASIVIFNGTFGYFFLTTKYGSTNGIYTFLVLSVLGILTALIPLFLKSEHRYYHRVLLYTNVIVAFNPLFYKLIATYLISKLL